MGNSKTKQYMEYFHLLDFFFLKWNSLTPKDKMNIVNTSSEKAKHGAREMFWWFRAIAAITEDEISNPQTYLGLQ